MSGKELGKVICDTYWDDSKKAEQKFQYNSFNGILTISVVDLSEQKMDALKSAYDNFGKRSLAFVRKNPDELIQNIKNFNNAAGRAERFPANTSSRSERWYNESLAELVDVKGFAENTKQNFPELKAVSDKLARAVSDAVIYKRNGNNVKRSNRLSTYYPFDLLISNKISYYNQLAGFGLASQTQGSFYKTFNEDLINEGSLVPIRNEKGNITRYMPSENSPLNLKELANTPIAVEDGVVSISIDSEKLKGVEAVRALVGLAKPRTDGVEGYQMHYYGIDSDMQSDWQSGAFKSKFNSEWLTVDNNPVFVQILSDYTKRNKDGKKIGGSELCQIPISLNGLPDYYLAISVEYPEKKCKIIGVFGKEKGLIPNNEIWGFKKGDVVTFMYPQRRKNLDAEWKNGATITIGKEIPKLEFKSLPDGDYCYVFEFLNLIGDSVLTEQLAIFKVKDGKISDDIEILTFEKN